MMKVNVDEINQELERFNSAVNSFRPYTQGFIKNTAAKLTGFNSDYIDEMKRLLNNMADSKAPKLLQKAENLHKTAKKVVTALEDIEKQIANKLGE